MDIETIRLIIEVLAMLGVGVTVYVRIERRLTRIETKLDICPHVAKVNHEYRKTGSMVHRA